MDWLGGFFIFQLRGPDFLALYAAAAAATLLLAFLAPRRSDPTRGRSPPLTPKAPDAVEIAYLAGGVDAVIRTLLFDLRQRDLVEVGADDRLAPTGAQGRVDERQRSLMRAIAQRPTISRLFRDKALRAEIESGCAAPRARLLSEDLLRPAAVERAARVALVLGSIVLIGLAGVKIAVALSTGHSNIAFLAMMAIMAEVTLIVLARRALRGVASARGRAYLEAVKTAYDGRLAEAVRKANASGAGARAFDGGSLFLVALFGFAALKDTPYAAFAERFAAGSSDSSSSCGSSGGDGGGDGGGGCGGCGGGGD
jgi:uncharacterized protein (TIGR04222 family)